MMEILASNLSIILAGVLSLAGIVLTIYLKFPQLRYPFLSLKIILGTLDWSGTRGKITPGRSFAAGTLTAMIPGAFLGTLLAVLIAGPGVVVWIWIVSFFISPIHFVLSTAAHRSRKRTSSGSVSGSVPDAVRQLTRSRWLSILSALFFIPAALFAGAALPVLFLSGGLSGAFAFRPGGVSNLPGPTAIAILVALGLVWITAGGIRRIGLYSKFTFYGGVLLLLISFLLGPLPEIGLLWDDIWKSFQDSADSLPATILGLTIYMA
ncbi:MAG: alanine:cation symporter family protein, partial [Leptospiraceae bacterium]|nr:alanine:cation symporter family protein [Leptospiraceae bacterium]